jgi:hypothetical protein
MTELRKRMEDGMVARGFARRTRSSYLWAVTSLTRFYRRSPDQILAAPLASPPTCTRGGQNLSHHLRLHCLVTGGGPRARRIALDSCAARFPVSGSRAVARLPRGVSDGTRRDVRRAESRIYRRHRTTGRSQRLSPSWTSRDVATCRCDVPMWRYITTSHQHIDRHIATSAHREMTSPHRHVATSPDVSLRPDGGSGLLP